MRWLRKDLPEWGGHPAPRYLMLIAITVLIGISLIMAFSASSNDAVIRQVQQEFAQQQDIPEGLSPEELIEYELDQDGLIGDLIAEAQAPSFTDTVGGGVTGVIGFISALFNSAYAAGFRHLLFAFAGAIAAIIISRMDYRKFAPYAIPFAAALLLTLLFLLIAGRPILGSARWINFGFFSFQPSEFAKPILIVLIAYYCSWAKDADEAGPQRRKQQSSLSWYRRDWVFPAILIAGCLTTILLSPDVGTTVIIGVGLFAAYVLSGWPWGRVLIALGGLGSIFLGRILMSDGGYQQRRIFEFVTRWTEGITPYQTWQAELALGSGGILGLGPGLSRQKFRYLPEAHNDFIIAILGEELGLIGIMLVLISFALILFGGLYIASQSKDRLGMAIAGGATALIVFQALLNIFAVVSLGPITGKPLPFITLGGSAMISTFMLIGLILSVARFGHVDPPPVRVPGVARGLARGGFANGSGSDDDDDSSDSGSGRNGSSRGRKGNGTSNAKRKQSNRGISRPKRNKPEEKNDDEDDLEWRWDSRAHLSRPRPRR